MIKETLKLLNNNHFTLIPVEGDPGDPLESRLSYNGDLDTFVEILKKNKISNIFYMISIFEERDVEGGVVFHHEDLDEHIPLKYKEFFPEIEEYVDKVGEYDQLKLFCKIDSFELEFLVSPEWYEKYKRDLNNSQESQNNKLATDFQEEAHANHEKKRKVNEEIEDLIGDDYFIGLKTISSMIEYVRDNIDNVDMVSEIELKGTVSRLNNKLKARGLKK